MSRTILGLLLPATLLVSCDPFDKELSKREARNQLESLFEVSLPQGTSARLAPDTAKGAGIRIVLDAGALEGLWRRVPWRDYANEEVGTLQLTEKGKQFFHDVEVQQHSATVELARPLTRTVQDVLRVNEDGAEEKRIVLFRYRWDAPDVVLRYIGERSGDIQGTARFERIDGHWKLMEVPLRDYRPFHRDPEAETAGRAEQEERCRPSSVETNLLGKYRFNHHMRPTDIESFELEVSDVAFRVTRRFESSGQRLQTVMRSHYWGDVVGLDTENGHIEMTVLLNKDRRIDRLDMRTYRIAIEDDGKALPPLSDAARVMTQAWTEWHQRFFDCLPEPTHPWITR